MALTGSFLTLCTRVKNIQTTGVVKAKAVTYGKAGGTEHGLMDVV